MTVFGVCEKGNYRAENQDSILMCHQGSSGLFVVADGVGGSADGAGASHYITRTYGQWWEDVFLGTAEAPFFPFFAYIKRMAEWMNDDLCREYGVGNSCSTLALLFLHQGIYGYLSVGDSRIYRCGRGGAKQMTRDDVWENRPDANGDARHAGKLVSAVGGFEKLEYSCATDQVRRRDVYMLCSDGIYRYVREEVLTGKLRAIRRSFALKKSMVDRLAQVAVENDTRDNYSVIVLKV